MWHSPDDPEPPKVVRRKRGKRAKRAQALTFNMGPLLERALSKDGGDK